MLYLRLGYFISVCVILRGQQLKCMEEVLQNTNDTCIYKCRQNNNTLMCDNDLPDPWNIPEGTTDIYITNYKRHRIDERKHVFNHTRWQSIRKLKITSPFITYGYFLRINDYDFASLPRLEYLGLHATEVRVINYNAFVGMVKLSHLDLSGCINIISKLLVQALGNPNCTFKLTSLVLDDVGNLNGKYLRFDVHFLSMLRDRNVIKLSIQRTNVFLQLSCSRTLYNLPLEYADMSDLVFTSSDERPCPIKEARETMLSAFENIKVLNISRIFYKLKSFQKYLKKHIICNNNRWTALKSFDMSHSFKTNPIQVIQVDLECFRNLTKLYLNSNSLTSVNLSIVWPQHLQHLDLSSNKMTYISPQTLNGLLFLKCLHLENNLLYNMQGMYQLKHIFHALERLRIIDLSNNHFNKLPSDIFLYNDLITSINLKDNKLTSLTLTLRHLHKLKSLNLQNNRITHLDNYVLHEFQLIFEDRKFDVNMIDNYFQCVCEHYTFLKWIKSSIQRNNTYGYTCTLGIETVPLDTQAIENTLYLCHRASVILGISLSSVVSVGIISISIVLFSRFRQRKKQRTIKEIFLHKLLDGNLEEKYLVFLSYCNDDCDFVRKHVKPELKASLFKVFNIGEGFTVTGDDFKLGMSIFSEIFRCIESSCVVIFVVSNLFCKSQWCQMELREAVLQNKPIILLFKENVEPTEMSNELRATFDRNTRSNLVQKGEIYEPVAGWIHCCESIVKISCDKFIIEEDEKKRNRVLNGQEYHEV